ncbi:MotA/TolQ/ExbB proton channel family protein [Candidatus Omnitrophota bacterium]
MIWIIIKGGPLMIPILLGSVIGLAIIIEKFWSLLTIKIDVPRFVEAVFFRLREGQTDSALKLCKENIKHPLAKIFKVGIERKALPVNEIEKTLERIGMLQINDLEKYLGGLISIIGIEPLLGFLGTITGLIKAFMAWEQAGSDITVSALAQGIYQAMITTAAGLSIAVPFYLLCNYIISRIKYISRELSNYSMELTEVISELKREGIEG